MSVDIAGKQRDLEEEHAGAPHGRAAAESGQNELADQRLHLKQQKRAGENCRRKTGH